MPLCPRAVATSRRAQVALTLKVRQRRHICIAHKHDVAAAAAIAAVGAAVGHKLLTTKANDPVPAIASLSFNFNVIDHASIIA